MAVNFVCSACGKTQAVTRSSGDCLCQPKDWGTLKLILQTAQDDDGTSMEEESNDLHLCDDCMENCDVDKMARAAIPSPRRK